MKTIPIFIFLVLSIIGCKSTEPGQQTISSEPLRGTGWELVESFGKVIELPDRSKLPYFILNVNDNKFTGNTACNSMFGNFFLEEGGFVFSEVASTEMYCEYTSHIEQEMFKILRETDGYQIEGNTLILFSGEEVIGRFSAMEIAPEQ